MNEIRAQAKPTTSGTTTCKTFPRDCGARYAEMWARDAAAAREGDRARSVRDHGGGGLTSMVWSALLLLSFSAFSCFIMVDHG